MSSNFNPPIRGASLLIFFFSDSPSLGRDAIAFDVHHTKQYDMRSIHIQPFNPITSKLGDSKIDELVSDDDDGSSYVQSSRAIFALKQRTADTLTKKTRTACGDGCPPPPPQQTMA